MNPPGFDQNTTLQVRRLLAAPRERVFRAWIERDALQRWLKVGDMEVIVSQLDVHVGGSYRFEVIASDGTRIAMSGTYLEIRFPEKLVFTWISSVTNDKETLVSIEFIEQGASTEVILTHDRFTSVAMVADHQEGWVSLLDQLASVVQE